MTAIINASTQKNKKASNMPIPQAAKREGEKSSIITKMIFANVRNPSNKNVRHGDLINLPIKFYQQCIIFSHELKTFHPRKKQPVYNSFIRWKPVLLVTDCTNRCCRWWINDGKGRKPSYRLY